MPMRFALVVLAVAACQSTDVSRDVGARCAANSECNQECLTGGSWPGGFCTLLCDSDADCPSDTRCIDEAGGGVCAFSCAADPSCTFLGASYTCDQRDSHGGGAKVNACRG
ncbi:hypothetical protein BH11MYX1_BH11MYX1_47050 [soil metagenome]